MCFSKIIEWRGVIITVRKESSKEQLYLMESGKAINWKQRSASSDILHQYTVSWSKMLALLWTHWFFLFFSVSQLSLSVYHSTLGNVFILWDEWDLSHDIYISSRMDLSHNIKKSKCFYSLLVFRSTAWESNTSKMLHVRITL